MIKVVAIVLFIVFGLALLAGLGPIPAIGFSNFTAHGGFLRHRLARRLDGDGVRDLQLHRNRGGRGHRRRGQGSRRPPCRARCDRMVGRLILFYLGAIVVLIGIVPWNQIQPGADVTASPFVKVFQLIGVPAAAHVVNFVVITAAASSMNCNLYLCSRMMFSLARGGYAPGFVRRRLPARHSARRAAGLRRRIGAGDW